MRRHHDLFQTDEVYSQCVNMVQNALTGFQREINPVKKLIGDRKKEVIKISTKAEITKHKALGCTRAFYEHALNELMDIEKACEKCLIRLKIDLLTATKDRMQPPSYLSVEEMSRGLEICCDALNQTKDEASCCYNLENQTKWDLEGTEDITFKSKGSMKTEFDESDLKFKRDMMYLRSKMFSLPRRRIDSDQLQEDVKLSLRPNEFVEHLREKEEPHFFFVDHELSKLPSLKFVDGFFKQSNIWSKILDIHGNQYGSKWHVVLCPQIERILRKRIIPILRLNPRATFNFLSRIEENGVHFVLDKRDLIDLVESRTDACWLKSWLLQFRSVDGERVAATLIQACWRGYVLRRNHRESDCMYIAASYLWFSWISLQKRRELYNRYMERMLISLQTTRELSLKLSKEFSLIITLPHVIVHLPSIGHHCDVRKTFDPKIFRMVQNVASLRICMVRNPQTEVIYVLPLKPTKDLLMMYSDFIESMYPTEDVLKRITFIALSEVDTFKNRAINISRVLHCSEDSLKEIQKKIAGRSAYILPWFVDECDLRLAGYLDIPLLSPDMQLQHSMLNVSTMAEMIEKIGLKQPINARHIKDYNTLCSTLANFMVLHTEICIWLFKLNFGILNQHFGIFLINHISVPFMYLLRKEREKYGDAWTKRPSLREEYLQQLMEHLPRVVSNVTRLSKVYKSWKEFYLQVQKHGCLLQAIPVAKNSKTISVSLFLFGKESGKKPKWIGTADKLNLASEVISTFMYMMPQSSLDTKKLRGTVNKFATAMQNEGYNGYLTIDCYCYIDKYEKLVVLVQNIRPFYSFVQSYLDWLKFAVAGFYNEQKNKIIADIAVIPDSERKKPEVLVTRNSHKWNETKERYGIIIGQLYHTRFFDYRWPQLKDLFERCDIVFDPQKKQGSTIILHDNELRNFGMMMAVTSNMVDTATMVHNNMIKLHEALVLKSKKKFETNLPSLIDFFERLTLEYENLAADKCLPNV